MKHFKSQSLDNRETTASRASSRMNSSIYEYLKDRKQKNLSRTNEKVVKPVVPEPPNALIEAASKRSVTDSEKFTLMLNLLQAKINVMGEHTFELQNRLRALNSTFSSFCDEYMQSPSGRQTVAQLNKLRQQVKTTTPVERLPGLQRQLKKQLEEIKERFAELMLSLESKCQQDLNLLRSKLEQDRSNSQLRLQSTIDTLSYNNFIVSKLNRGDGQKIRTELSKYQHLRKKHQQLVIENERIRTSSIMQKFSRSTQLHSKQSDEEYETAVDENVEQDY